MPRFRGKRPGIRGSTPITDRKLLSSNLRLGCLAEAIEGMQSAATRDVLLGILLRAARRIAGADGVAIVLRENGECHYAQEEAIAPLFQGKRFPLMSCVSGQAMVEGRTRVVPDVYADERIQPVWYEPTFVKSLVVVPIGAERATAAVGVYWARIRKPDDDEVSILETLARAAGTALRNLELLQSLTQARDAAVRLHGDARHELEERERAEVALRQNQERQTLVLDAIVDYAIFTIDVDGIVTSWNEGARRVLGWGDEMVGRPVDAIHTPEDRAAGAPQAEMRQAAGSGRAESQRWHMRRDGTRFWGSGLLMPLTADGRRGFVKVLRDRTGQRRAADALMRSEARFRSLSEAIPQLVWTAVGEGCWTWGSRQWVAYTGQADAASHGLGWLERVHPDDRDAFRAAWRTAQESGRLELDHRLRRADGEYRWFQTRALPVRDAEGAVVQWCGTCTDISDLKAIEAALRTARDEAEDANRTKSRFLAAVSHDLRQPVQAANLFIGMAQSCDLPPDVADLVDRAAAALENLNGMLSGLLEVARLEAGIVRPEIRPFRLDGLLDRLRSEFGAQAQEARLSFTVGPAPQRVASDPLLVELILRNLISNAIKYTRRGGVTVTTAVEQGTVRIAIADTGVGIPPEEAERIFQDFYQVGGSGREHGRGFGMGLATVARAAKLLGTGVTVRSEPGRGSTFTLHLPREEAPAADSPSAEAVPARPAVHPSGGLAGRSVLVVDDERLVLGAMTLVLRSWGMEVFGARSLAEVRSVLDRLDRPPDLILSDYTLSHGELGTDAVALARERGSAGAVVVTGDTSAQRLAEAEGSGYRLLHKPVLPDDLKSVLEELVAQRLSALPSAQRRRRRPVDGKGPPARAAWRPHTDRNAARTARRCPTP